MQIPPLKLPLLRRPCLLRIPNHIIDRTMPQCKTFALFLLFALGAMNYCLGAFVISFEQSDLKTVGPGPLTQPVNVLVTHDGTGASTFSSLSFDIGVEQTDGSVTLNDDATPNNPLGFDLADINATTASFADLGAMDDANVDIGSGSTVTLTTLSFDVPDGVSGEFPISLSLAGATRGGFLNQEDIASEFTVNGGTLQVSAVPEPSSFVVLTGLVCGGTAVARRRKKQVNHDTCESTDA